MKHGLWLVMGLFFISAAALAQDNQSYHYIGIGGGIDIPAQNWDPDYKLGGGAKSYSGPPSTKPFRCKWK